MASTEAAATLSAQSITARIERIPFVGWHVRTRLLVGIATFFNGFDLLAVAYALPVLGPLWHLSAQQSGLLLSALFMGELVGAVLFGYVAERLGRRRALLWCTGFFSVMSIASGFAGNYEQLLVLRFLVGVGLGSEVPVAVSYISEISKAKGRGSFILIYELIFPVGLVLAGAMGWWVVTHFGWRPLLVMGGIPALFIVFMQRYLPESPRWLAQHGRLEEADAIVSRIEQAAEKSLKRALPPPVAVEIQPVQRASWKDIIGPRYLQRSLVLWLMYFCCFFVNFGLASWLPTLYTTVYHLSLDDALRNTLITQSVGFLGTLSAALLIDIIGRKLWFGGSFVLSAIALGLIWRFGTQTADTLLIGSVVAFFFISTISIAINLYGPELYPTRMRAIAVCIGFAMSIIAGIVGPIVLGVVVPKYGLAAVFAIFAVLTAIAGMLTLLFAVETRGRILEEVSP